MALLSGVIEFHWARERFRAGRLDHCEALNLAVHDFWHSRMGRHNYAFAPVEERVGDKVLEDEVRGSRRIAVSANTGAENVTRILAVLRKANPSAEIVLFGHLRRKNLFRHIDGGIWRRKGVLGYVNLVARIATGRFDVVILNAQEQARWAHHLSNKLIRLDAHGRVVSTHAPAAWHMLAEELLIPVICLSYFAVGACRGFWRSLAWNTIAKIEGQLTQLHRQGI